MDTSIVAAIIAGTLIFFLTKMKESEVECLKLRIERKQMTPQPRKWIGPNPSICEGTVLYTAFNEPLKINSFLGDHFLFMWYDATDAQGGRVTVKVYDNPYPSCEYVFQKEQDAARMLAHPGIVKIVGNGRIDGCPFSVFENMAGGALRSWLQKIGNLTGSNVLSVVRQVADALDFAHERGIIHSDVQPAKVWLDPDPKGRVALAEFGVRQAVNDVADPESPLPGGFYQYSAPEQYSVPESRADERVDIYCFGVMCYELIAGIAPWRLPGRFDLKRSNDAPDIRTRRKDVPESLALRLAQTLSRDPGARPCTAAAVLAGVEVEIVSLGPARRRAATVSEGSPW